MPLSNILSVKNSKKRTPASRRNFFHTLKVELVHDSVFVTREQAKLAIFDYMEVFYNQQRLHSTLGYCSPEEFEQQYLAKAA